MIPKAVLRSFGADGTPRPLAGGQGTSWTAGDLVFKPEDSTAHAWLGEVFAQVKQDGFRLAEPVRARDGAWAHDGWTATRLVAGSAPDYGSARTWQEILTAGRAFHRAVAHLPRPGFMDERDDPWAVADRVAWGERTMRFHPLFAPVARRLREALEPLGEPQIVHGDLTGNVLFAPGLPPAVIDVSPYWRPPAYADGIVIADALCWHGLRTTLDVPAAAIARGLLFRMATGFGDIQDVRRYERAADLILGG
ncbi:hypothetical protein OHA21_06430 [Actinoplanes sp. NBC_00393]|uniref:TIGR02569 family protein n=1 Tax=Actinoplanes sp. NBC_00393 TaxID=2975953 RepID=UPI002E1ADC24